MNAPTLEWTLGDYNNRVLDYLPVWEEGTATWIGSAGEGAAELVLPPRYDMRTLKIGRWLNAWVRYPGEPPYFINSYLIRKREQVQAGRRKKIKLRGLAPTHILGWRAIQSPHTYENTYNSEGYLTVHARLATTGFFAKEGFADNVMKQFVRENCTAQAASPVERSFGLYYNFSVQPDHSLLPKQTKVAGWNNLLEVCKALTKAAREDATRPYWTDFEVVVTGHDIDFGLEFRVYVGQRGRYRGLRSETPLVLTPQHFENWTFLEDHESEVTASYLHGVVRSALSDVTLRATTATEMVKLFVAVQQRGEFPANFIEKKTTLGQAVVDEAFRHEGYRLMGQGAPIRRVVASVAADGPVRLMRDLQPGDVVVGQVGPFVQDWRLQGLEFHQTATDGLQARPRFEVVELAPQHLRLPGWY